MVQQKMKSNTTLGHVMRDKTKEGISITMIKKLFITKKKSIIHSKLVRERKMEESLERRC